MAHSKKKHVLCVACGGAIVLLQDARWLQQCRNNSAHASPISTTTTTTTTTTTAARVLETLPTLPP